MANILIWGITDYLIENKLRIDWSYVNAIVCTDNSKEDLECACQKISVNMIHSIDYQYILVMDEEDERYLKYADENHIISKESCGRLSYVLPDTVYEPVYNFINSNIYAMGIRSVLDVDNGTISHGYILPNIYWPKYKLIGNYSNVEFPFYTNNLYDESKQAECALFLDPFEHYGINQFIDLLKNQYARYPYVVFNLPMHVNYPKYFREWSQFPLDELGNVYVVKNDDCGTFCMWEPELKTKKRVHMHVISHKPFRIATTDKCYSKLYVGEICDEISGDDNKESVGDNIHLLNPYINENTGIYWAWKNDLECDYIGFCHYRRFFTSDDITMVERHIIKQSEIERYLETYDLIVAGPNIEFRKTIENRLQETIDINASNEAMEIVRKVISEVQPEYLNAFEHVFKGYSFFPCNMYIMPRDIFDKYCQWLFSIIPKACDLFDLEKYDNYSRRAIGFIAERMLTVWLMLQPYRVKELPIQQVEE